MQNGFIISGVLMVVAFIAWVFPDQLNDKLAGFEAITAVVMFAGSMVIAVAVALALMLSEQMERMIRSNIPSTEQEEEVPNGPRDH